MKAGTKKRGCVSRLAIIGIGAFAVLCVVSLILAAVRGGLQSAGVLPTDTPRPLPTATLTPAPTSTAEPTAIPPTAAPTIAPTPTEIQTPQTALESAARKMCQTGFVSTQFINDIAIVTCKLGDNFSNSAMIGGAVLQFQNIAKATMPSGNYGYLRVIFVGQFKNATGNISELPALSFFMPRPLYDKINWQNMTLRDTARLLNSKADGGNVDTHSAWREDWAAYVAE